jgi:hypothetical protein
MRGKTLIKSTPRRRKLVQACIEALESRRLLTTIALTSNTFAVDQGSAVQIDGRLENDNGVGIGSAQIGAEDPLRQQSVVSEATTDADGTFHLIVASGQTATVRPGIYAFKLIYGGTSTVFNLTVRDPAPQAYVFSPVRVNGGAVGSGSLLTGDSLVLSERYANSTLPFASDAQRKSTGFSLLKFIETAGKDLLIKKLQDPIAWGVVATTITCGVGVAIPISGLEVTCPILVDLASIELKGLALDGTLALTQAMIDQAPLTPTQRNFAQLAKNATGTLISALELKPGGGLTQRLAEGINLSSGVHDTLAEFDPSPSGSGYVEVRLVGTENDGNILAISLRLSTANPSIVAPPVVISPGTVSNAGLTISGLTPRFAWNAATNASGYGLYIRDLTTGALVYPNAAGSTAVPLTGTSLTLPAGILQSGRSYKWNMTTFVGSTEYVPPTGTNPTLYFSTPASPDVTPPTANLFNPANGSSIDVNTLNGRGWIQVTFPDLGSGVDPSTILDTGQDFTLAGTAAQGVSVNGAPVLVSGTASTYRYALTGTFGVGPVTLNFPTGAWADYAGNVNIATSQSFTVTSAAGSTGTLQVVIPSQDAINSGAQWRVNSGPYQNSGATLLGLLPGSYTVQFKSVTGLTTPLDQSVTIVAGQISAISGTYALAATQSYALEASSDHGNITRNIYTSTYPAGSQVKLTALPDIGYHFVSWSGNAVGTQNPLTITMDSDKVINANWALGDLTHAALQVTMTPSSALSANAAWSTDGGATYNIGNSTLQGLAPGTYNIKFWPLGGFTKPIDQTVILVAGQITQVAGSYVPDPQYGNLQVGINPPDAAAAGGQWRIDGGAWLNSASSLSNLPVGAHTIDFKAVTGWITPASQTVQVALNRTTVISGAYSPPIGAPFISSISPGTAPLTGGTQVVITGANFTGPATVTIGGIAGTNVSVDSATQIRVTVPASITYGTAAIVVTTPSGILTSANGFAYAVPRGVNLELAGQIGGLSNAVAIQGNYAYLAVGAGLDILSLTNPSSPAFVGHVALPGLANGLSVAGQYLYVADDDAGLEIVDVSNPAAPRVRGFYATSGPALGITTVGGLVYLADGNGGVQIVNVANPDAPTLVGSVATPSPATQISVHVSAEGVAAYVIDGNVEVVNVSNPLNPVITRTISQVGSSNHMTIAGAYAYVSISNHGMDVYSIASPFVPAFLARFQDGSDYQCTAYANGQIYASVFGYVQVNDVSNPAAPVKVNSSVVQFFTNQLVAVGNHIYVAGKGMQVVDISTPSSISLSGSYVGQGSQVMDVAVSGTTAYILTDNHILTIVDATNPGAPVANSSYTILPTNVGATTVVVSGKRAYVAGANLSVIDVSNPFAPSSLGTYSFSMLGITVYRVLVVGNTAYAVGLDESNGRPRFAVLDVSNPASITSIGGVDFASGTNQSPCIAIRGSLAYVVDHANGLQIVNFSNSNAPTLRGKYAPTGSDNRSIALSADGNYAFIADGQTGFIKVVDVRNPDAPSLVSSYDMGSYALDVVQANGLVYVGAAAAGVKVFDVSDPSHLVQVASYRTPFTAWRASVSGDYVYVAETAAGLGILHRLDVTPPSITITNPLFGPSYTTNSGILTLGGIAADNVGVTRVLWSNDRGGSGTAVGTDNWIASAIILSPGNNVLTATAYDAAGNSSISTLAVNYSPVQAAQTTTFGALANKTFGDAPFSVNATTNSGLALTYSVLSGPASIAGNLVTITGAGTVVVRASQAGNAYFTAAPNADQSFTVSKSTQTITFGTLANRTFGDDPFTVNAIASSGLPLTLSVLSGPAVVSNNTVTLTGAGTVTLRASQPGDANNYAAANVDQSFSVAVANQTISFGSLSNQTLGDAPFPLNAAANSGLPVSFSVVSGPAVVAGNIITLTGVGPVVVRSSQPGNANYNPAASVDQAIIVSSVVLDRHIFYNNSAFDNNDPTANAADDAAIATDKQALVLPGQMATFANYTSYTKGLNGLMVDVSNLANGASLSASDFLFKVGNNNDPTTWTTAPAPTAVIVRPGSGTSGSDRIEITFADGAIQKQWLQVTVLADANTGLSKPDVFYFGNAVAETGDSSTNAAVNSADDLGARTHKTGLGTAAIINVYDFNRDMHVDTQDELIARSNHSGLSPLKLITVPASTPSPSATPAAVLPSANQVAASVPSTGLPPAPVPSPTPVATSVTATAASTPSIPPVVAKPLPATLPPKVVPPADLPVNKSTATKFSTGIPKVKAAKPLNHAAVTRRSAKASPFSLTPIPVVSKIPESIGSSAELLGAWTGAVWTERRDKRVLS